MIITAEQRYSRQTPTRLRLVSLTVKDKSVAVAMDMMAFMNKKSAKTMLKVFKQAVANAKHNFGISADQLTIKEILVNEGPRYRRFQPVSRGRAHAILKRTSHIRVILEAKEQAVKPETKKIAAKVPAVKAVAPTEKTSKAAAKKKTTKK